ncbi:MAG TPA: rod shape-determining protein RodA [Candidatus Paceibacterota bacterium]|nr:rod shape-determining protein RodA [Candidatus Paceibacterota bacterium]HRZ34718.1 rod shape-determining protein RodA [Candidatus Paceibacterota bacterium]
MTRLGRAISIWARGIDWILFFSIIPIVFFGLITIYSFIDSDQLFSKQLMWFIASLVAFVVFSSIDFKFLRQTKAIVWLYGLSAVLLVILFLLGEIIKGSKSWFDFGAFSFQPVDLAKLVLVLTLAKYFSRRHIEIRNIRHILVSGVYALIFFVLVALQPDFGSAIIIFLIWFGMVMVSGISKRHLLLVFLVCALVFAGLWGLAFKDYQKDRIITFLNPLHDIRGAGYNAYQSMIAVGSGEVLGKGLGYGTQSRLKFLPEYQTDFVFAAFAEEWGFVGVLILFVCYGTLISRILSVAKRGATNFETLYALGLSILIMSHFIVHVGMNVGLLPVTGLNMPFMSYGGTNLFILFIGVGILMSMRRYSRATYRDLSSNEIVGIQAE